ncbi:MAG TPA: phosphatase [Candidatus Enterenecus stercoripullorum]|nr:phosphatase [Candidatus Enterenecus stercoripullorum]
MYAVIDIGSNTMRLVLYRVVDGEPRQMLNSKQAAGLAGYVDKEQRLSPKGIQKAIEVLRRFQLILDSVVPRKTFVFATASLRNVVNTQEVVQDIRKACGLEVRVLTGQEEALLDYSGTLRALHTQNGLLVDIGGGSTELVRFRDGKAQCACSLPMGSLNMYTRYVRDVVPTTQELKEITHHACALLQDADFPVEKSAVLYGVGGTCRASCALSDELFDEQSGYAGYPCKRLKKIRRMLKEDRKRLISAIIKTAPDRLHTLLPGLAILEAVAARYGCASFSASPYGVREGYLLHMLEGETEHE